MGLTEMDVKQKLTGPFNEEQASVLAMVVVEAYTDLVKTSDFNELKEIVRSLAQAQQRTEQRVEQLAQAQQRTEQRVEELAQAQQRTEQQVQAAARQIELLARQVSATNTELGGLSRSAAYALENEAYRYLPGLLAEKHGLEVTSRVIRTHIQGEEVNIFGHAKRNGVDVLLVGETKLRLDERRQGRKHRQKVLNQLMKKIKAVETAYPDIEIVPLLVTHYARPAMLQQAEEAGVIVVQSFEW